MTPNQFDNFRTNASLIKKTDRRCNCKPSRTFAQRVSITTEKFVEVFRKATYSLASPAYI